MDILIYGGTFNPPHKGHAGALRAAVEHFHPDRILVIPTALPPHKDLPDGTASPRLRMELCRLAFSELPGVEISDLELRRSGVSYTVDTLEQLRGENPDARLLLLMGGDMVLSLLHWRAPERILQLAEIVVVARTAEEPDRLAAFCRMLETQHRAVVHRLETEIVEISSTQLRRAIQQGCGGEYLAPAVLQQIEKNGCYRQQRYDFEAFRRYDQEELSEKRCRHVFGCEASAVELAKLLGVDEDDARAAALLHDITKELGMEAQLNLCEKYGIILDDFERTALKLLHAKTGAALARDRFRVPEHVAGAIYWHTTGKADMSPLEKVLFMADYIEPTRDFDGVEDLRRLVYEDFDQAMILGLELTQQEVAERGGRFHHHSAEALEFLRKEGAK